MRWSMSIAAILIGSGVVSDRQRPVGADGGEPQMEMKDATYTGCLVPERRRNVHAHASDDPGSPAPGNNEERHTDEGRPCGGDVEPDELVGRFEHASRPRGVGDRITGPG